MLQAVPQGRERRRKGPINELRRALYGLMLSSASVPAMAAGHPPAKTADAPHRLPRIHLSDVLAGQLDSLMLHDPAAPPDAPLTMFGPMSPLLSHARSISPDFVFAPIGGLLLTAHFLGNDLETIGKGLGADFLVPELGYFHLNLYNGPDGPNLGKRWKIAPNGFALPKSADKVWSLGGTVDVESRGASAKRELVFVPQLVLNLDSAIPMQGRMQAVFSYRNWRSTPGLSRHEAVPQVSLKWNF